MGKQTNGDISLAFELGHNPLKMFLALSLFFFVICPFLILFLVSYPLGVTEEVSQRIDSLLEGEEK